MTVRAVRAAAIGAALLGLLAIVALASGGDRPATGTATDPAGIATVRDIALTLALTLFVLAIVAIVWAVRKYGVRTGAPPETSFGLRALVIFLTLVAVLWILLHFMPERLQEVFEEWGLLRPDQFEERSRELAERGREAPPARFRWDVVGIVLALAAAGVALAVLYARRKFATPPWQGDTDEVAEELAAVIEGTLEDLRAEADPRRAVIAAYAQMEQTLGRHGHPRRAYEAPFEYLARILKELRVRATAILALTELFERARFSRHTIDETMKGEAIEALVAVRDDLTAAA
jgi:hypothetical protein